MHDDDPYYQSTAARWLRDVVERVHGIEIIINDQLTAPVTVSRDAHALWLRPGLDLADLQWLLGRALLYHQFGTSVVPEFHTPQRADPATSGDALVIPIRREFRQHPRGRCL